MNVTLRLLNDAEDAETILGTLRVTELAEVTGRSQAYIRTLMEDGTITPAQHRVGDWTYLIPLKEARRIAREMGVIE